jgi:hypothetical protein
VLQLKELHRLTYVLNKGDEQNIEVNNDYTEKKQFITNKRIISKNNETVNSTANY